MKLSVYEAILTGLWPRNCATIQQVLSLKFAFGPEKVPSLLRKGPPGPNLILFYSIHGLIDIGNKSVLFSLFRQIPGACGWE